MDSKWLIVVCISVLVIVAGTSMCKRVSERFSQSDPVIQILKQEVGHCFPELGDIQIFEGRKSYTVNKERIYLCLRDKHGQYYSHDILMYVLIHEIAHMLCPEIGHTQKFKDIFNSLIENAMACGIYTPVDIPSDYCME